VITGVPADASFGQLTAMSGDASAFAGGIARAGSRVSPPFPARIDANGVVTELPGFGASGNARAINADGSVLVGDLLCDDPPTCATQSERPFRWINGQDPEAVYYAGSASVLSTSGTVVAGTQSDLNTGTRVGFRASSNRFIDIPELDVVTAMSTDGEFIAGRLSELAGRAPGAEAGALWSSTQGGLIALTPRAEWTSWAIDAMSDDGGVFAGYGYANGSRDSFIWRDGTFSDFPKLPGADYDYINGMSSDGSVIAGLSGTNSLQRAFLWDQANGMRTVLAETVARGLELPLDLELVSVDYLSDDGRTLVGWVYASDRPSFWRVTLLP
jgi:uncharacterized membrane protein